MASALVGLLAYSWMFTEGVPNERSRLYLSMALVDHGTLHIDELLRRHGVIFDLSAYKGHYYTDKAPGSSLLGALIYGSLRLFSPASSWSIRALLLVMRWGLMIPITVLGFFVLRNLMAKLTIAEPIRDICSMAWALGSAAFHYGRAFYGHQIVAVCLLLAVWLLWPTQTKNKSVLYSLAAGALCGLAAITEYQAAIPCIFVACFHLWTTLKGTKLKLWWAFCVGAVPFAVLLFTYNYLVFENPFALSYHHLFNEGAQSLHTQGIGGVGFFHWQYFLGALFSGHRGLLATSPWLMFVVPGVVYGLRQYAPPYRGITWLMFGTVIYYLAFISGSNMWFAGWSFGLRLFVPALPLCTIFAAMGMHHLWERVSWRILALGTISSSILYNQVVGVTLPELPPSAKNPIFDTVVPLLSSTQIIPNWVSMLFGRSGGWSAVPVLMLAVLVCIWLVYRAIENTKVHRRNFVLGTLCVVSVFGATAGLLGPSWSEQERVQLVEQVRLWSSAESQAP
ncbi:MAG: hypothetical protein H6714_02830 [Myxococcales bacterium]|nr:hypothetical protein [Myxococcales bacterium]